MRITTAKGDRPMKVTCNYSEERFDHKPTNLETGHLQKVMTVPREIEVSDLADLLVHGGNMRIAACDGGSKDENFRTAQLIGIDCDNEAHVKGGTVQTAPVMYRPGDVRRILSQNGIKASFQYGTWSNTDEHPKFRTILVLDRPITDIASYQALVDYIVGLFSEYHADRNSKTVSRIFYGSGACNVEYADYDAVNSADDLLARCGDISRYQSEHSERKPRRSQGKRRSALWAETANQKVVNAIRNHNSEYLRRHIGNKRTAFETTKELYDHLYRIPLDDFLEVDRGSAFKCILPGHEDNHPSASVFQTSHGIWKYKCHANCQGDGSLYNLKQLIEILGAFKSEYQAIRFICEIFNLRVRKTEWSEEQNANIDRILTCITAGGDSEEAFSNICPTAAKVTRNAISVYIQILIQAKQTIYPEKIGDGNIIFYLSIRRLASAANKKSLSQVQGYIKQLCYCRMLEILEDKDIPLAMLKRARASQQDGQKRTNFFSIPSWVLERTRIIESYGNRWRENGYRIRGISYEMFYRVEPSEAARLYPDSKTRVLENGKTVQRTTTKLADARHMEISQFVIEEIQKNGYCTEKMIIDFAKNKSLVELQIQRSITDICNSYGFKKCRSNKALRDFFKIPGNGYPNIIIPED